MCNATTHEGKEEQDVGCKGDKASATQSGAFVGVDFLEEQNQAYGPK